MKNLIEKLQFNKDGHMPAIIVDADNGQVLTLCYLTKEALAKTLETNLVHVFRRSKGRVMLKGETSGHTQQLQELRVDCEGNSLLAVVRQKVAACHAGYRSCYYRRYRPDLDELEVCEEKVFEPRDVYGA